jgi:hypothetical protein
VADGLASSYGEAVADKAHKAKAVRGKDFCLAISAVTRLSSFHISFKEENGNYITEVVAE